MLVCSWSGLIRKVSNSERRLALDFGSFVNAFCFPLPFSVTAFCSAWQKRRRLGLVAVLHVKLYVVQRKDCGVFFACLCTAYTVVSIDVDNYKVILMLLVKIKYLFFNSP